MTINPANPPASDADLPLILPLPRARLPRRLAAILYDSLLLAGLLFIAGALALMVAVAVWGGETVAHRHLLQGNPFFSTYLLLVCFFFYLSLIHS